MLRNATRGAAYGALAWFVCGATETVISLGPRIWNTQDVVTGWQWRLIVPLLGTYALVGLVLGGLAGLLLTGSKASRENYCIAAALTITLAYAANWITASRHNNAQYVALGV